MKLCFVIQRYGLEVNGGAELHCRQIAEHLQSRNIEVHVLTSKSVDYITWENKYTADLETVNGVVVHRFGVAHPRKQREFDVINDKFFLGRLKEKEETSWIESQGPAVPELLQYLKEHEADYDAFVFFTYLYYQTVMGLPLVAKKAVLVPDAHDEPFLKMKTYQRLFRLPGAFVFNTEEEMQLVHEKFHNERIPFEIGGAGVEVPEHADGERFKRKYGLDNYCVYVGRIDEGKNWSELYRFFTEYKKRHPGDLKLVTIGKAFMPLDENPDFVHLGFLPEDADKFDGIKGAKALILPSRFESLSIVVLEAMSMGTPVLVNGACEVLRGHCRKSNGAFYYTCYADFEQELEFYLTCESQTKVMTRNSKEYVTRNYQWKEVLDRFCKAIEYVVGTGTGHMSGKEIQGK